MTLGDYFDFVRGWLFITGVKIWAIALGIQLRHTIMPVDENGKPVKEDLSATEEHPK